MIVPPAAEPTPPGAGHTIRAVARITSLGPKGEGWLVLQLLLLILIVVSGETGPRLVAARDPIAEPLQVLGGVILLAGFGLVFWSYAALRAGRAFSAVPRPVDLGTLVETGPYRIVRHPLYAGLLVAGIGTALVRLAWIEMGWTALLFVVLDLKRRREEAWLLERYPAYAAYRSRTKALVPFLY
jgi:protein-S-isoprenylcysteine O-methyltransferase Ste14